MSVFVPTGHPSDNIPVTSSAEGHWISTLGNLDEAPRMARLSVRRLPLAQQAALMRLQLYFTGETHRILGEYASKARGVVQAAAGEDGVFDAAEAYLAQQQLLAAWQTTFMDEWLPMFQAMRREAASIPFGAASVAHEKMIVKPAGQLTEQEGVSPVFEPQLQALIDAANQRVYQDGLQLSQRIWRLDRETREGLNRAVMSAISESKSAWQVAGDVEQFLGAGKDCPRWTSTRLFTLTKKDIASGDRRGLKTGEECKGQGVSYNALRLARNEIQAVHHLASDEIMAVQPWIEMEQINLSPAHPPIGCECEDVVVGGDNGDGVYPKGTITLPIHVHCLCYKTAVVQSEAEFTGRLRDWVQGGPDSAFDQYAQFLGIPPGELAETSFMENGIARALGVWLWGGPEDIAGRLL